MSRKHDFLQKTNNYIGQKLCSLRMKNGMTRTQLATIIKVSQQQISKYEKGIDKLSLDRLIIICKAFNITLTYFYEGLQSKSLMHENTIHQQLCIELSKNFMKINNDEEQKAISTLVQSLAKKSRSKRNIK